MAMNKFNVQQKADGVLVILCGEGRARRQYENGERTDRNVEWNGKPVLRYPAMFSVDGRTIYGSGSLDTTSELSPSVFGEVFHGLAGQMADVSVSPVSQYEMHFTVSMENVVPVKTAEGK